MSDNLELVQEFTKQYQAGNETQLARMAAPDFLHYINLGEAQNFKHFIERMWLLRSNSVMVLSEISNHDDNHFFYNFTHILSSEGDEKQTNGLVQVVTYNGLITRVFVDFEEGEAGFSKFQKLMSENNTVLL